MVSGVEGRKVDRNAVRALATKESAEIMACAKAGGNVFQLTLDHQDAFDALIEPLPDAEKLALIKVHTQELNALTLHLKHSEAAAVSEAQERVGETDTYTETYLILGKVLGLVVIVGMVLLFIYRK
ncbi:hypothetical protein SAMN04490192_1959 [Pseudomonas lundensis]|uniref:hypothetical protein n=1 Tax=Pseudomonas lundensis TaxID=86185 RepID=UPI0008840884|nr:hypothetical protein [Pseudomonas lundensis]SDQ57611.1 hypothetical protein SAMN04490192_1959 [Pseudomonas lundensis]